MSAHVYHNEELGFSLTKPDHWVFLPTPWGLNIRNRGEPENQKLREILKGAKEPFLYCHFDHGTKDAAYPTVQVVYHVVENATEPVRNQMMRLQIEQMTSLFSDFSLIRTQSEMILAGCPAFRIESTFTIRNDVGRPFACRNRTCVVFSPRYAFTIGMSGPAHGPFQSEEAFDQILRSVRIRG